MVPRDLGFLGVFCELMEILRFCYFFLIFSDFQRFWDFLCLLNSRGCAKFRIVFVEGRSKYPTVVMILMKGKFRYYFECPKQVINFEKFCVWCVSAHRGVLATCVCEF